jgi:hypothetical protein
MDFKYFEDTAPEIYNPEIQAWKESYRQEAFLKK